VVAYAFWIAYIDLFIHWGPAGNVQRGVAGLFEFRQIALEGINTMSSLNRRDFLKTSVASAAGFSLLGAGTPQLFAAKTSAPLYSISLAQWSLHKALFDKKMDHLDFARTAKEDFGIDAVEYVNSFFFEKAKDAKFLDEMNKRAADVGVKNLLIMIDREGNLGDPDDAKRTETVEKHYKWVEAARHLGCHSIRVNARSKGSFEETQKLAADGLRRLTEFADTIGINVIVENHGGLSSNGQWLAGVMDQVGHQRCGTLPDFGNFRIKDDVWYDRYKGVKELMPYAKAVSAKSHDFDENGDETKTDYEKMMKIVLDAGYRGYVGIEYEGQKLSEADGIKATKALLEKVREKLAPTYS